jgi:peptide/nickel transport system permease protein
MSAANNVESERIEPGAERSIISRLPISMIIGGIIVLHWLIGAVAAPLISEYDPIAIDFLKILHPPSASNFFGTDELGRDIFTRVLYAARIDIWMGVAGVFAPMVIGVFLGLVAGYMGGIVDKILMRIVDITLAFPFFVLVLAIVAMLGPGLANFIIALALVAWVAYARLIRAEVQIIKKSEYIQAAQTLGFSPIYIMLKHVLPNALSPIIVFAVTDAVLVILLGASLGFLGLGVQPPTPEWGVMIANGQTYISSAWWISFFPGIATVILGLGLALIGNGLSKLRLDSN